MTFIRYIGVDFTFGLLDCGRLGYNGNFVIPLYEPIRFVFAKMLGRDREISRCSKSKDFEKDFKVLLPEKIQIDKNQFSESRVSIDSNSTSKLVGSNLGDLFSRSRFQSSNSF